MLNPVFEMFTASLCDDDAIEVVCVWNMKLYVGRKVCKIFISTNTRFTEAYSR